ncbi:hypothetical protein ACT2FY_36625 [Paraburkholderia fungorum]|uniref:hypothetical protein n=1 Tax=Paraburkholderia fungorum TaxID=134537 RepID=UPI00402B6D15
MDVKPLNVTGATIVVQVCLLFIVMLGVVTSPTVVGQRHLKKATSLLLTVVLALLSILAVVFTRDFYSVWSPILSGLSLPTLPSSGGLLTVFWLDIIFVSILMTGTGGAKESPFTSVLFLIPALGIFLREPPSHFFAYATAVAVVYLWNFRFVWRYGSIIGRSPRGEPEDLLRAYGSVDYSHAIVNMACLMVAMFTGYITRPFPV